MQTFQVWIRVGNYQTTHIRMQAESGYMCQQMAESMYGQGNVINWTYVNE